jgi:hypothetical protein
MVAYLYPGNGVAACATVTRYVPCHVQILSPKVVIRRTTPVIVLVNARARRPSFPSIEQNEAPMPVTTIPLGIRSSWIETSR